MKKILAFYALYACMNLNYSQNPGDLDLTFSSDGKLSTDIDSYADDAHSVAVQNDGKIVVAGSGLHGFSGTTRDYAVVRYNLDGSLDNTFGIGGIITTDIGGFDNGLNAVLIQSDGKIIGGGVSGDGVGSQFGLVRYNSDGSLDNTFGVGGIVITDLGGSNDGINALVIQSDGKIIAGGTSSNGSISDFAVARYNSNGSLDNSFDSDGIVVTDFDATSDQAYALAMQADGKILLAGTADGLTFGVIRYNSNGSLDYTFDLDGKVTTAVSTGSFEIARGVLVQPDQKIVVVGRSYDGSQFDCAIVRYNADGTLDNSFDGDGKVVTPIGSGSDQFNAVVYEPDNKIVAGGSAFTGSTNEYAIVRYNLDGSLDLSFNLDGIVTTTIESNDGVNALAIQPDLKLVAVGRTTSVDAITDFSVARYITGLTVEIDGISFSDKIHLGPNPNQGLLNVSINDEFAKEISRLQITDLQGRIIYTQTIGFSNETHVDLSSQAAGLYFLQINTSFGQHSFRIIVQ